MSLVCLRLPYPKKQMRLVFPRFPSPQKQICLVFLSLPFPPKLKANLHRDPYSARLVVTFERKFNFKRHLTQALTLTWSMADFCYHVCLSSNALWLKIQRYLCKSKSRVNSKICCGWKFSFLTADFPNSSAWHWLTYIPSQWTVTNILLMSAFIPTSNLINNKKIWIKSSWNKWFYYRSVEPNEYSKSARLIDSRLII